MTSTRLEHWERQRLSRPTTMSGWKYVYPVARLDGTVRWRARVRRGGRLIQVASGVHFVEVARAVLRYLDEHDQHAR